MIFLRLEMEIPAVRIGQIVASFLEPEHQNIEASFFRVPIDPRGHAIFEKGVFRVGEQNLEDLKYYRNFYHSEAFLDAKGVYREDPESYEQIIERVEGLILGSENSSKAERFASFVSSPPVSRLVQEGKKEGQPGEFIVRSSRFFHTRENGEILLSLLKSISRRIRKDDSLYYKRVRQVWDTLVFIEDPHPFFQFLELYGDPKDEFESFIWETTFGLEPVRAAAAIPFFISQAFLSICNSYRGDRALLQLLTRNIITAFLELNLTDFQDSLFPIVLKLLLNQKVDRRFLKKRADFAEWQKENTGSYRVELELIRFMFFEYIFIALKKLKSSVPLEFSMFCNREHRFICEIFDGKHDDANKARPDKESRHTAILELLRDSLYSPIHARFPKMEYEIQEIRSVAESTGNEDDVLFALDRVENEHDLTRYHEALINLFRNSPEDVAMAVPFEYWYSLEYSMALPHIATTTIPLLGGSTPVFASDRGAYTDGSSIYLPQSVAYFKDPIDPLVENRNLSVYIGLALHEAGHILAGSFHFDLSYYLMSLERPELFRLIHNVFEDFRIEEFMIRINAHPQGEELIRNLNLYLSESKTYSQMNPLHFALFYIMDQACDYNASIRERGDYIEKLDHLENKASYPAGRFRGVKELLEYGVSRLQNLDVGNPLSAYPLSREFYEILKHWPEHYLEEEIEKHWIPTGIHRSREERSQTEEHTISAPRVPMSTEELDNLYRQYNEDPRGFLEQESLPIFPEVHPESDRNHADNMAKNGETSNNPGMAGSTARSLSEMLITVNSTIDYSAAGTIDFSTRTQKDDLEAEQQLERMKKEEHKSANQILSLFSRSRKKNQSSKKKGPKHTTGKSSEENNQFVFSINPKTRSRTILSEIREFPVDSVDHSFLQAFKQWSHIQSRVRRIIAKMVPELSEEHDFSNREGELNLDLVIETIAQKQFGTGIELYDRFTENRRSLVTIVGLDASGSTASVISNTLNWTAGERQIRGEMNTSIIDVEKAFAMIFAGALEPICPDLSIYAFNSSTSTSVFRANSIRSISAFQPAGSNRDGDFIRYMTSKLVDSDAEVKYFFLISDGQPASVNYEGKEALEDTILAMRECRKSGISLIYCNIDAKPGPYYRALAREATWSRQFSNPEELLPAIPDMILRVVESIM